jgi:putative two-component system response regulator
MSQELQNEPRRAENPVSPHIQGSNGANENRSSDMFDPAVALFTAVRQVADEALHAHENKVGAIAGLLAAALGRPEEECAVIAKASTLHDIGKFAIPKHILGKKGPLDAEEIKIIHQHAENGAEILMRSGLAADDMAVVIARYHHEKFDGSGYPEGLIGQAIPLAARITAVADVYDALRATRPYKDPINHENACDMILNGSGRTDPRHFDPEILQALKTHGDAIKARWSEEA